MLITKTISNLHVIGSIAESNGDWWIPLTESWLNRTMSSHSCDQSSYCLTLPYNRSILALKFNKMRIRISIEEPNYCIKHYAYPLSLIILLQAGGNQYRCQCDANNIGHECWVHFLNLSALSKHTLPIKYHVYIRHVSPNFGGSDTCQIRWSKESHHDVVRWKHFPRYWPFVRGLHRSPANSPHKGQWRGALIFFYLCLNKGLNKQLGGWWFETPSRPLWRHYNVAGNMSDRKDGWSLNLNFIRAVHPVLAIW